jgi:RimJ/RimL family protein N-acetyltransferase
MNYSIGYVCIDRRIQEMIKTRILNKDDSNSLDNLINAVVADMEDEEWWKPISKKARNMFLDGESAILIGAFNENNELVAASGLFFFEMLTDTSVCMLNRGIAEIGRCMVLPEYRGDNLMLKLNRELVELAKKLGKMRLVATAHPDNVASCHSLEQLGFTKKCLVKKWKHYSRDYYTYDIKGCAQIQRMAYM